MTTVEECVDADEYDEKWQQATTGTFFMLPALSSGLPRIIMMVTRIMWVNRLKERLGFNKTTVAVANKNVRIIWSILGNEAECRTGKLISYQQKLLRAEKW